MQNKNNKGVLSFLVVIVIIAGIIWFIGKNTAPIQPDQMGQTGTNTSVGIQTGLGTVTSTASYACNDSKTIKATFYTGSTTIALSDGRTMTLGQTVSADGGRYANPDESFVFWSKGNGALVLENNAQKSYMGCITVAPNPGNLPNVYQNGTEGVSLRYPAGYTVDTAYKYEALGPSKTIYGVKFTIPKSLAQGTNLSNDSYVSVESIPNTSNPASCTASAFVQPGAGAAAHTVTVNDTTYSVASTSDAGAGNRYEETVHAIPGTNPCVAIRYFVHYGAIGNYPAGAVKEFDRQALMTQFDQIRNSLILNR
jgi:membrane-bound inhibitor of C-type lysozyme